MKKETVNLNIIISIFIFFILSVLSIYTTIPFLGKSLSNLYLKQTIFYLIGLVIMFFISFKGFNLLKKYHLLIYIGLNFLLLFLLIFGYPINGSKCWIIVGPLSFQPSELMKISLIITLSMVIKNFQGKEKTLQREFILLIKLFILALIPIILTFLEPDTGVVIIYLLILFTLLFFIKLNKRWYLILSLILVFIVSSLIILYFFKNDFFLKIFNDNFFYRIDRIINWSSSSGYQLENSLIVIANSGVFGFGYNKNVIYFPEPQTDFIFTTFVSNFGLLGSLFLILIILVFDTTILRLATKKINTEDKYILIGIFIMLFYGQVQNIGMTLGLLPITGIPLPFISYGGTSLIIFLFVAGIILNINKERFKYRN